MVPFPPTTVPILIDHSRILVHLSQSNTVRDPPPVIDVIDNVIDILVILVITTWSTSSASLASSATRLSGTPSSSNVLRSARHCIQTYAE